MEVVTNLLLPHALPARSVRYLLSFTCAASWISEMSSYIKSIDSNHMISIGDEGFFNNQGATDWPYDGSQGIDFMVVNKELRVLVN